MIRVFLEYRGNQMALPCGVHVIGRGLDCCVRLNDATVSREHLRLEVSDGLVQAIDPGSRNGTLLNGHALSQRRPLQDGDQLQIGGHQIRVVILSSKSPTGPLEFDEETVDRGPQLWGGAVPLAPTGGLSPAASPSGEPPRFPKLDRRKNPRFRIEVALSYVSDRLSLSATAHDLSLGGVFISTGLLDQIGARCDVTFLPETRLAVPCRGVVRHISDTARERRPAGMGVEFTHLGMGGREWLGTLFGAA